MSLICIRNSERLRSLGRAPRHLCTHLVAHLFVVRDSRHRRVLDGDHSLASLPHFAPGFTDYNMYFMALRMYTTSDHSVRRVAAANNHVPACGPNSPLATVSGCRSLESCDWGTTIIFVNQSLAFVGERARGSCSTTEPRRSAVFDRRVCVGGAGRGWLALPGRPPP